jgi:hypothetical protein
VQLDKGKTFDANLKDGYKYETVGGNHSRQALQELLKERPELYRRKVYSHRLCSVYSQMPSSLTLRIASKHNRASIFTHDMTTGDKITQCRCLLYEMGGSEVNHAGATSKTTYMEEIMRCYTLSNNVAIEQCNSIALHIHQML